MEKGSVCLQEEGGGLPAFQSFKGSYKLIQKLNKPVLLASYDLIINIMVIT